MAPLCPSNFATFCHDQHTAVGQTTRSYYIVVIVVMRFELGGFMAIDPENHAMAIFLNRCQPSGMSVPLGLVGAVR